MFSKTAILKYFKISREKAFRDRITSLTICCAEIKFQPYITAIIDKIINNISEDD